MPVKPMIAKKRKDSGLTPAQFEHLLKGYCLLSEPVPWHSRLDFPFPDEAARRRLWFENRDLFLKKCEPGKRPSGFWDYETTERRRVVSGDASLCMWLKGTFFGNCRVYDIEHWDDPRRPIFESQSDYLKRHGLAAS